MPGARATAPVAPVVTGLLALVVTVLASLLGAAPAAAHARFTGSDPAEGAQVRTLPAAVVMSYSEQVAPQFVETAVIAPDATTVPTEATADGLDVTVDLATADLPDTAGTWQVVARVVSVDGHPVEHTTSFVVAAQSAQQADPTTDPATDLTGNNAAAAQASPGTDATSPAADPTADPNADPTSVVTDALPRWALVAGAAVVVLAAAAALLVQLRRRPPAG